MVRATLRAMAVFGLLSPSACVRQKPAVAPEAQVAEKDMRDTLPAVDSVLEQATDTLTDFVQRASQMQTQVTRADLRAREALAAKRALYEKNLTEEATITREHFKANVQIRDYIERLEKGNDYLRNQTATLRKGNELLHDAFRILEPKMRMAELFLEDSIRQTNSSGSQELKVLQPAVPQPTLEHFLEVANSDINIKHNAHSQPYSLLAINPRDQWSLIRPEQEKKQSPSGIVDELSSRLTELSRASAEGDARLKAHFLALHELAMQRRSEVLGEQASLNATRYAQAKLQTDLHHAKEHLLHTKTELQARLEAVQSFTLNVDDIVADALDKSNAAVKSF